MTKQQEKALKTKHEIMEAAASLFVKSGYFATSVKDICTLSGYSVGAFYGHFSSKIELAEQMWVYMMTDNISTSVEKGSAINNLDDFVDYIVGDSEALSKNKLMYELHKLSHSFSSAFAEISPYASRYLCMLYLKIKQFNPSISEDIAWSTASTIHGIINANSQKQRDNNFSRLTPDAMKTIIRYLIMIN